MEMDLQQKEYDRAGYEAYILGSAEVVGLMCLKVFTEGDNEQYRKLTPFAMRLGAAFQKINFLRDMKDDFNGLGRAYFPGLDFARFDDEMKARIEEEIEEDFDVAYKGILMLPKDARLGVLIAYVYYRRLFAKIRSIPSHRIMEERIRIPNSSKYAMLMTCYIKNNLNLI
jgi:phytoene/squalene synthetase